VRSGARLLLPALLLLVRVTAAEGAGPTLYVSAAASLTAPLREIKGLFLHDHPTVDVALNLGASGVLETQIEQGAPVDIFISAGRSQMRQLQAKGLVDSAGVRTLAQNRLVLIVPAPGPGPNSLDALVGPAFRHIALGSEKTVPAGQYAAQTLRKLGLYDRLRDRLVPGQDVKQVLEYVASGSADAGFVYESDVHTESMPGEHPQPRVTLALVVPDSLHEAIVYPVALMAGSANGDLARRFLDLCVSGQAREILARFGFRAAPPAPGSRPHDR